jgi:hypothetical protein
MDCCGHGHVLTRRRWIWSTLTSVAAMVGGGVEHRAVRPPQRRPPKPSPLRSLFCGSPSRSTSIRMAEPAGSHQQRLPAMTSRRRCGRDRWRSPALRTCRTLPSLPGVKRASSPPLRRRSLALFTNTISSGSIGWTKWSLRTVCAERFPQPISRRRITPDSPRLWVMWKGSIFSRRSWNGSRRLISGASGMSSLCTTHPTTLETFRRGPLRTGDSPHSVPR